MLEFTLKGEIAMLMATEVVFKQGLVKTFICTDETRVVDFAERINGHGKVRLVRWMKSISAAEANALEMQGAIRIN